MQQPTEDQIKAYEVYKARRIAYGFTYLERDHWIRLWYDYNRKQNEFWPKPTLAN